jgi:hypothetical protein
VVLDVIGFQGDEKNLLSRLQRRQTAIYFFVPGLSKTKIPAQTLFDKDDTP